MLFRSRLCARFNFYFHSPVYLIVTDSKTEMPIRLKQLYEDVSQIIETYKPEVVSIEELFFNSNAKTAILVGQARGVAVLACANYGLEIKIKPHAPLLVRVPVNSFEFHTCVRTPQAECLMC